jgi:hypothetical protein
MANLGAMDTGGFVQIWCVGWRDLRQQHDVLKMLYEQVARNDGSLPVPQPERALDAHLRWLDELETSIGARDAYATAVVMFVDDLLKRVYGAYKAVPGPEPLTAGLRGVPLHRLFKATGNNVRHYQDWNKPWELAITDQEKDRRRQMKRDVAVLAEALNHRGRCSSSICAATRSTWPPRWFSRSAARTRCSRSRSRPRCLRCSAASGR